MNIYFYYFKNAHPRKGNLVGVTSGVLRAENYEIAEEKVRERAGDNAYAVQLLDVSEHNAEAYFAIPTGMIVASDNW